MVNVQQTAQQMTCTEVWGGNELTERGVQLGGLDAWVYSKPFGEAESGGDIYYASTCATGRISRLLLADVAGHGRSVAGTAAELRTIMRRFINHLDQTEFVRLLNQQFLALSRDEAYATAIVTTFFAPTGRLSISNAGHPRPLLYRAAQRQWSLVGHQGPSKHSPLRNMPLGILHRSEYEQFDIQLDPGDCVLTYTDALIESRDADGETLGEAGLLKIVSQLGDVQSQNLIALLLSEIAQQYPENLSEDDVTVLVIQANGREPRNSCGDELSELGRFSPTLIGAIDPSAERPPFPDADLPNIGGALIPALGRKWRARDKTSLSHR
jgi:sigma-B regulation protein RsbU (phosphoserine phosphatase)